MTKKGILRIILIIILIIALSGIFILAEENPEDVSGVYTVISENADSLKIGDHSYNPVSVGEINNKITF
jgi:hypothetical protein